LPPRSAARGAATHLAITPGYDQGKETHDRLVTPGHTPCHGAHGHVLRGRLVLGNWGDARTYQHPAEVRTVITS